MSLYLFDGANHLKLRWGVEVVAFLAQQQAQVPRDVSSSDVHAHDGVWDGKALVDGHDVSHTVPWIQHYTGGTACGVPAWNSPIRSNWEQTNHTCLEVLYLYENNLTFWWLGDANDA